jgi:hypothetical protein
MNFRTGTTRLGSSCQLGHRADSGKKTKKLQMSKGLKFYQFYNFRLFCPKDNFFFFLNSSLINHIMGFAVSLNYFAKANL